MLNWAKESNWLGESEWQCLLCLRALCSHFARPLCIDHNSLSLCSCSGLFSLTLCSQLLSVPLCVHASRPCSTSPQKGSIHLIFTTSNLLSSFTITSCHLPPPSSVYFILTTLLKRYRQWWKGNFFSVCVIRLCPWRRFLTLFFSKF